MALHLRILECADGGEQVSLAAKFGAAHYVSDSPDKMLDAKFLDLERWRKRWSTAGWKDYLAARQSAGEISALRHCTHTGRPLGTSEFVARLEKETLRPLAPRKGGQPKKPATDPRQDGFAFVG